MTRAKVGRPADGNGGAAQGPGSAVGGSVPLSPALERVMVRVPHGTRCRLRAAYRVALLRVSKAPTHGRVPALLRASRLLGRLFAGAGLLEQAAPLLTEGLAIAAMSNHVGERVALEVIEAGLTAGARRPFRGIA